MSSALLSHPAPTRTAALAPVAPSPPAPAPASAPRPESSSPPYGAPLGLGFDLALALTSERGWPEQWRPAPRHSGLACAVIDAVMTPHVRTETVAAVVQRYRDLHSPEDGPAELARSFEIHGDRWPDLIGTRNRAWRDPCAPLKSDVIAAAADLLTRAGVTDPATLCAHAHDVCLRTRWTALPGQATGATWRHLLLVSGYPHPMVCRLTRRFVRRHAPTVANRADEDEMIHHMQETAAVLRVPVSEIDHQMWRAGARGAPRAGPIRPP